MNIYELAFSSYIYSGLQDFDNSYMKFLACINNDPDMNIDENRQALIDWLNDWGCRNFYVKYHGLASEELHKWYQENNHHLPENTKNIWEFSKNELNEVQMIYDSLINRIASYGKTKSGKTKTNSFGHTPASKILFALRPNGFIPWDLEMRKVFKKEYNIKTYRDFLIKVAKDVEELRNSCNKNGFGLKDVPIKLKRYSATIPKLIDEYHWITITRNCKPPDNENLKEWVKWNY